MLGRYVVPDMPSADELLPYLRQIDENRWYSNFGPLVTQFEDRLELHLSTPEDTAKAGRIHLTTVMTCYDALQIGLQLFRLHEDAKVLVPAITFPACPLAVRHTGAEAVLADVDADSWQLTPETAKRIAEKISIHAVMPVAVYGVPVDADAWDAFSDDTGIPVIIDAAAALDAQPLPAKGLVAHSMHATKPFSIGEGGILISRRGDWIEEARCLSNFGTMNRITLKDGINAKLSEYLGAVALAQLDRWHDVKQRRRALFTRYRKAIESFGLALTFQQGMDRAIVSAFMLRSGGLSASHIANALNGRGIFAHRMYLPPLYHHPFFADLKVASVSGRVLQGDAAMEQKTGLMKNSEDLQQSVFGLPFHNFMDDGDIDYILQALTEVMDQPQAKQAKVR
jgi:dTDP-4-amino-4,6-dideoxygalactose transaminase